MLGLEKFLSEFQDIFGAFKQIQCAKDMLEDMSAQSGKFCVLFCPITGKFLKVFGGTVVNGSGLVWVLAFPSSAGCGAQMWAPLGCNIILVPISPHPGSLYLISPATLSEPDCCIFTSGFFISMQMTHWENKTKIPKTCCFSHYV